MKMKAVALSLGIIVGLNASSVQAMLDEDANPLGLQIQTLGRAAQVSKGLNQAFSHNAVWEDVARAFAAQEEERENLKPFFMKGNCHEGRVLNWKKVMKSTFGYIKFIAGAESDTTIAPTSYKEALEQLIKASRFEILSSFGYSKLTFGMHGFPTFFARERYSYSFDTLKNEQQENIARKPKTIQQIGKELADLFHTPRFEYEAGYESPEVDFDTDLSGPSLGGFRSQILIEEFLAKSK